jgi:hypothetical protein
MSAHPNVGRADAWSRWIMGSFAIVAGIVSIDAFFEAMPFITWLVLSFMLVTGLFYLMAGWRGGTAIFGAGVMALAVLDGWLALSHAGYWALVAGLVIGADAWITAWWGFSPLNALLHRDTHDADAEWHVRLTH